MRFLNIPLVGTLFSIVNVQALNILVSYESKCPASQKFIDDQLIPFVTAVSSTTLQAANVSIQPVPYGNAEETVDRHGSYSYKCQHGFEECYLNRVEACGIAMIGELKSNIWAPWVSCVNKSHIDGQLVMKAQQYVMDGIENLISSVRVFKTAQRFFLEAKKQAGLHHYEQATKDLVLAMEYGKRGINFIVESTADFKKALEISKTSLSHSWVYCDVPNVPEKKAELIQISTLICTFSPLGQRLQHTMAEMTPTHTYVPWVTFDREHKELAESNLGKVFCDAISPEAKAMSEIKAYCAKTVLVEETLYLSEDNYTKEM